MRVRAVLVVLILASMALAQDESARSFDGWTVEQIAAHRKKSRNKVKLIVRRWADARDELVIKCPKCKGRGTLVQRYGRGRVRAVACPMCKRTGGYISRKDFLRVFWEYQSRAYKTPERQQELEDKYRTAQANPTQAVSDLAQIKRHKRIVIEVRGNFAMLTIEVMRGGLWQEEVHEFIEDKPGCWCIRHPDADAGFVRRAYPDPTAPGTEGAAPPTPTKGSTPTEGATATDGAKRVPDRRPKPRPTIKRQEDPSTLFKISQVNLRHVEEDAYKVFGMVKNITTERRFAYIIVEVGIFKGDQLVDTASCNVGTAILLPGKSATFQGFIYFSGNLEHDRLVPQVVKFTGME